MPIICSLLKGWMEALVDAHTILSAQGVERWRPLLMPISQKVEDLGALKGWMTWECSKGG